MRLSLAIPSLLPLSAHPCRHSDDHEAFQRTLPPLNYSFGGQGLPSPPSPSSSLPIHQPDAQKYNRLISSSTLPSQLSVICRNIHSILTGPKAARRAEEHNLIDAHGMREIWNDLDRCWREFDTIRCNASTNEDSASRCDTERYACAWMIFIFECREYYFFVRCLFGPHHPPQTMLFGSPSGSMHLWDSRRLPTRTGPRLVLLQSRRRPPIFPLSIFRSSPHANASRSFRTSLES